MFYQFGTNLVVKMEMMTDSRSSLKTELEWRRAVVN